MRLIRPGMWLAACCLILWAARPGDPRDGPEPPVARVEARRRSSSTATPAPTSTTGSGTATTRRSSSTSRRRTPTPRPCWGTPRPSRTRLFEEIVGRIKPDRRECPVPEGRLPLLPPLRGGPGVQGPLPPQGLDGGAGRGHAGRQRAREGERLLLAARPGGEPQPGHARLRDRHGRPPVLHPPVQGPRLRGASGRRHPRRDRRRWCGPTTTRTVFYVKQDPETLRSDRVYRHVLGTDPGQDALVYEEPDDTFSVSVGKSRSRKYLTIVSSQTLASEYRFLDADDPRGEFEVFEPRQTGPRVRGGSPGRHVLHPHEPGGEELPSHGDPGHGDGPAELEGGRAPPGRRLPGGIRALRGLHRPQRAQGRPDPDADRSRRREGRGTTSTSASRPTTPGSTRTRSSSSQRAALRVHVADHARVDLRLRHGDAARRRS